MLLFGATQYNHCHVLKYFTLPLTTHIALPCSASRNMIICLSLMNISSTFYMLNDQQYGRLVKLQVFYVKVVLLLTQGYFGILSRG